MFRKLPHGEWIFLIRNNKRKKQQIARKIESFDEGSDEASEHGEGRLFTLKFTVNVRDFKGQSRNGMDVGEIEVVGEDESEFRPKLFTKVLPHIKREIVFDENNQPSWADRSPAIQDLFKFVTFYDQLSKQHYSLYDVSGYFLSAWEKKKIFMYIHKYTTNVRNSKLYGIAERELIKTHKDRAGAQSNSKFAEVLAALKEKHGMVYQAHHLNWDSWASRVCRDMDKKNQDLDVLLAQPPPPELIQLFLRTDDANSIEIEVAREDNSVGQTINSDLQEDIQQLKYDE